MAASLVLDTGPFVALVHRGDQRHRECVEVLRAWPGYVLTTEAVLTETMYLVGTSWPAQRACLQFFLRGAFVLVPISREALRRVAALMEQYADVPMDYADATLVALAEEVRADQVFTLDRRGFSAYRLYGRRSFRLVP